MSAILFSISIALLQVIISFWNILNSCPLIYTNLIFFPLVISLHDSQVDLSKFQILIMPSQPQTLVFKIKPKILNIS